MKVTEFSFTVNGRALEFSVGTKFGQVPPEETLVETLRGRLGLTGSKIACNEGSCGCCTVILDGYAVPSCMVLSVDCDGKSITTIEGLENPVTGTLDPIQQAFIDRHAFQCGYCTPGIIMTIRALLDKNPTPTQEEAGAALSGNFCRCISQYHVFEAIDDVVQAASRRR
jgi:carbon-monoxide dehydrogenase small subunit